MGVDVIKMPFLATKLYTTPPRPDLVDRLRLIAQLDQGLRMGHSFRHAFARDFLMDGGDYCSPTTADPVNCARLWQGFELH